MSTITETVLEVEGMSCGSCVRHVDQALRTVEGVAVVEVRLKERRVLVRHDGDAALPLLVEALRGAGYPARAACHAEVTRVPLHTPWQAPAPPQARGRVRGAIRAGRST